MTNRHNKWIIQN